MVLEIAPGDERLGCRHHVNVAIDAKVTLAFLATRIGAIKNAGNALISDVARLQGSLCRRRGHLPDLYRPG